MCYYIVIIYSRSVCILGLIFSQMLFCVQGLKAQSRIKMNIVRCPPVTMVLIRRPDQRYQLGFSVQNGIVGVHMRRSEVSDVLLQQLLTVCFVQICSLMRGGIAERGGVRVGHRIIEINGQSVVATPHEKIVHILSNAVGEVNHHRSQLTPSPPNTDFSVISLLYTRGRYYTSLNESRKCRSKTQTRKTQKRAMSYV